MELSLKDFKSFTCTFIQENNSRSDYDFFFGGGNEKIKMGASEGAKCTNMNGKSGSNYSHVLFPIKWIL